MVKRALPVTLPMLLWAGSLWSQVPVGSEFQVNTYTTSYQGYPSIAFEAGGGFVVVWEGYGQDPSITGVSGQRYDASGSPLGSEFPINAYTTGQQGLGKVASLPGGGFVVVWTSLSGDGSMRGVFGRQFDAGGLAGPEFQVNTYTTERQHLAAVSADSAGNFIVVWQSRGQDGAGYGIYAQRYNASGAAQGPEFRVNSYTTGHQENASVSMDPAGNFVVAWNSNDGVTGYQVVAQRFDAIGTPAGEFQVTTPVGTSENGYPSVATDAAGNFVVAWTSSYYGGSGTGIFARRYDTAGAPLGSAFRVNTYTTDDQQRQALTSDPNGNFVVVWRSQQDGDGSGIFGQRFDALGAPAGGEFRLNTYTTGDQGLTSVASDSAGNFVASWTDAGGQDGSSYGVFAQRFLPDMIFRDGVETGDLSAWSASSTDGGDLTVAGAAALASTTQGLQGLVDDTAGLYVQDDTPGDETRYRARFYLDPNGFDPGEAQAHRRTRTLIVFSQAPTRRVAAVVLRRLSSAYSLMGRARQDDNTQADTGFFPISDGPHAVEIDLVRASGPDALDGTFELWIDGVSMIQLTGLDNNLGEVDFVRMGALSVKTGASGTIYWDEFESRRGSYIGLLP